jgi:hypothetical protein
MPAPEIIKLARRLQSVAYQHGGVDQEGRWSNKKYRDAADASDAALKTLLDAIDRETPLMKSGCHG